MFAQPPTVWMDHNLFTQASNNIWVVSSLQLPGQGAADAYLEFQSASGTHHSLRPRFLAGTWIVFPQRQRPRRLEDAISRLHWVVVGFRPRRCLQFEKCLPFFWQHWELAPNRFSPRLKCQIRLSNFQASWAILLYLSVGLKAGTLPGSTERSSSGFTAWHTPASYRFMTPAYKDHCNPQSPWGRFHSFLPCSWAWHVTYVKLVWLVPRRTGSVCVCRSSCASDFFKLFF